ncbi:hypothetical protein GWI33_001790 [Rhynchophorus ferrugineus]|uniref:Uncharacterized protein n=1 Tax=Rhynchophorus ferrugineus TaxID=354439 RepID=A0A834IQ02_RHYFE|nr:hypothetical protein GWI33_001790 [Rhynchophorus ferrugineus]
MKKGKRLRGNGCCSPRPSNIEIKFISTHQEQLPLVLRVCKIGDILKFRGESADNGPTGMCERHHGMQQIKEGRRRISIITIIFTTADSVALLLVSASLPSPTPLTIAKTAGRWCPRWNTGGAKEGRFFIFLEKLSKYFRWGVMAAERFAYRTSPLPNQQLRLSGSLSGSGPELRLSDPG